VALGDRAGHRDERRRHLADRVALRLEAGRPRQPQRLLRLRLREADRLAPVGLGLRSNAVRGYPDAFYDSIAAAYRTLVTSSSRPVSELATANNVPITTARRWVKEARRRGLLSPGHPGKAG
jgi:hypothetical protein